MFLNHQRKHTGAAIITIVLQLFSVAWATPMDELESLYDKCVKEAGTINNGVVSSCSNSVNATVKKEMNRLYKIAYKNIKERSDSDAQQLEDAQKAWLIYRNNHCNLMGSYVGSPMYDYCPMGLNIQRVKEFKELAGEN